MITAMLYIDVLNYLWRDTSCHLYARSLNWFFINLQGISCRTINECSVIFLHLGVSGQGTIGQKIKAASTAAAFANMPLSAAAAVPTGMPVSYNGVLSVWRVRVICGRAGDDGGGWVGLGRWWNLVPVKHRRLQSNQNKGWIVIIFLLQKMQINSNLLHVKHLVRNKHYSGHTLWCPPQFQAPAWHAGTAVSCSGGWRGWPLHVHHLTWKTSGCNSKLCLELQNNFCLIYTWWWHNLGSCASSLITKQNSLSTMSS